MKHIVITGATSGIGRETARALLSGGNHVLMLARNEHKARRTVATLKAHTGREHLDYLVANLADLQSVKRVSEAVRARWQRIDVLINNAGGIFQDRRESTDGFEMHLAVNHLGHFLLTNALLDRLIDSRARIINVSSEAHRAGRLNFDDLQLKKQFTPFRAYGNAKLCNIFFTRELHRRFHAKGISAFAVHPGMVRSGFGRGLRGVFHLGWTLAKPFMISSATGARTPVYLASEPGIEALSGKYFKKQRPVDTSAVAKDTEAAQRLWAASEELVEQALSEGH